MEKEKALSAQLEQLAQVDIKMVDPKDLVEIEDVTIRADLPQKKRIVDYIKQIGNPYCYLYHGIIVKVSFSGKRRMEDCLKDCLFTNI